LTLNDDVISFVDDVTRILKVSEADVLDVAVVVDAVAGTLLFKKLRFQNKLENVAAGGISTVALHSPKHLNVKGSSTTTGKYEVKIEA